jgi:hypothetical protein
VVVVVVVVVEVDVVEVVEEVDELLDDELELDDEDELLCCCFRLWILRVYWVWR